MIRVGFTGSRKYPRPDVVSKFIRDLEKRHPGCVVISGGSGVVDETVEAEAALLGLDVVSFRPEPRGDRFTIRLAIQGRRTVPVPEGGVVGSYDTFRDAALARNDLIVRASHKMVSFWDGKSTGTAHCMGRARVRGVELFVYNAKGERET